MDFAFALLSPDCVLSGSTGRALQFLADRNIQVAAHKWHGLTAAEVSQLYAANRSLRCRSQLDELVDELFLLSDSLCCLVTSADGLCDEALHRYLLEVKGPSNPFRCRPDQLRRSLGATNKILNLIHTSDTPADSLREAAFFFPGVTRDAVFASPGSTLDSILHSCPTQRAKVSTFETLNELKQRALSARAPSDSVHTLEHSLRIERELLKSQSDQVALFARLRTILPRQLMQMSAKGWSADLRALIRRLVEIASHLPRTASDAAVPTLQLLERNKVSVSPWESLVVRVEEAA